MGVRAALVRTVPKSRRSLPGLGGPTNAVCPAGERVCSGAQAWGRLPHRPTKAPPATRGRARGKGDPYPVSGGKQLLSGPAPRQREQLQHWADTDSEGSPPSGLKLFAQLGGGAGRELSLWAGRATPRVPCAPLWSPTRPGSHWTARNTVTATQGSATRRRGAGSPDRTVHPVLEEELRKSARRGVRSPA